MIPLHRLAHAAEEPFFLNPDLIVSIEAHPDTVVSLSTGTKVVVVEDPEAICDAVREWRVSILNVALRDLPRRSAAMALVRGTGDSPAVRP